MTSRSLCLLLLVAGCLVVHSPGRAQGCSCMPSHPQDLACSAHFVILAQPLGKKIKHHSLAPNVTVSGYKIKIHQMFKISPEAKKALRVRFLETAWDESMCGVDLKPRVLYVIPGMVNHEGRATINMCRSMRTPWNQLSVIQRKGFRHLYYANCQAKIRRCWSPSHECVEEKSGCSWNSADMMGHRDCQYMHSMCVLPPKRHDSTWVWQHNKHFLHCSLGKPRHPGTHAKGRNEAVDP